MLGKGVFAKVMKVLDLKKGVIYVFKDDYEQQ